MNKRTLWLVGLVGLLVVSLGAVAMANEAAAEMIRNRFSCAEVPGVEVTISGNVTEHAWNKFELTSADGIWTVITGPYKVSRNFDDLTGQDVTVTGYTGIGAQSQQAAQDEVNLLRAKTIVAETDTYDLTQVTGGAFGPMGGRNAVANRAQHGGQGKMQHRVNTQTRTTQ